MPKLKFSAQDLQILLAVACYYLSAELGYFLSFGLDSSLPFWPAAGVSLALMVIFGIRIWPGIVIGSLIVILRSFWVGSVESVQLLMAIAFIIAMGSAAEAIVGSLLIKKFINKVYPFTRTIYTFYFLFIVLFISLISTGTILLSMSLAQILSPEAIPSTAITLWIRNTVGILLFSPLILSFYKLRIGKITQKRLIESAIFITSSLLVIWLFKIPYLQYVAPFALSFVAIPFLLWLAFRFKGTVAIVGYVMVAIIAIYNTSLLKPPFYQENFGVESILLLQLYLIMIASSSLILASAVYERKQAQSDLRRFNENLESIVLERTQALKNEIQNRKEIQRKVELTNEELKKRNTELDNFVYSVSHDLRAPIASILGLINILKKEKKPDDIKMYIELMEKSAKQQDYFIREILDQSRNARLEVKSEPVQFNELIEETFEQLDYSNLNGNKFKKKIHINQEQPFYCDKWRLKVILNNIISNAIRYKNGKEPIIQVEVNIIDHKLQLSIADNGKGIGKHHLPNLGKMFYRATDKGAGSGLGLYIVKETVHKLNGSFFIDSEEGIGTTVKFEIPELAIHDN